MAEEIHSLLKRQLRRVGGSWDAPPTEEGQWHEFLRRISRAYADAAEDRYTIERAMEISSAELRAARDAAERANRTKSSFLANMSHEIRTPMNGVIGIADLLSATSLDHEQTELLETLRRSGDSLMLLLNDILDLSKIEAGHLTLEESLLRPMEIASDVVDLMAERAFRKGVDITNFVDLDVPSVLLGDPDRLRQILINLVGNAIKFTETGQVDVRVRLLYCTPEQTVLWFCVSDSGIGISEEHRSRMFQPFTQADESTTRRFGGTGLGLSICRKLVELMGGAIEFDSEPGKGSRFCFHANFKPCAASPEVAEDVASLRGMRVLFVDDHPTNRRIVQWQMQAVDIQPVLASDAEEALAVLSAAKAAGQEFDLLLLDYLMPGMDGIELANAIRTRDLAPETPIAFLSSAFDVATKMNVNAINCFDILHKPIKQRELTRLLLRVRAGESKPVPVRNAELACVSNLGLHVLLAEDNLINQRVATLMLKGMGCSVELAQDGVQALEMFRDGSFDVVLMDCQMPKMGGMETAAAIRQIEKYGGRSATPIVALTANAMESDRQDCFASGMDDFLTKPVRSGELLRVLHSVAHPAADVDCPK